MIIYTHIYLSMSQSHRYKLSCQFIDCYYWFVVILLAVRYKIKYHHSPLWKRNLIRWRNLRTGNLLSFTDSQRHMAFTRLFCNKMIKDVQWTSFFDARRYNANESQVAACRGKKQLLAEYLLHTINRLSRAHTPSYNNSINDSESQYMYIINIIIIIFLYTIYWMKRNA